MSHEIRTPLNGIIGMTDLLIGTHLDGQQHRFATIAKSSADSLLTLINDILDFSKIEAGKLELSPVEFDLSSVIEQVAEMLSPRAQGRGLEFASCIDDQVHKALFGDPDRLRQILINLTTNAIKFTEKGEVVIRVAAHSQTDTQTIIRFAITDTGIGIPADRMNRLFRSFSQIDASTTRKYGGTGLGLVICKQLVNLMGGDIGVESTPGKGSTFFFTARFEKRAQIAPKPRAFDIRGLKVLAVDDNATHCEILTQQLRNWGFPTASAPNGNDALAQLIAAHESNAPFAVAIIDMQMPGMNGLELAAAIKADARISDTVLLMLTGLETNITEQRIRSLGFAGYMHKPLKQSRLLDVIMNAIAQSKSGSDNGSVAETPPTSEVSIVAKSCPSSLKILLAEDNEINQLVAGEILRRSGYSCDIVNDGQAALESIIAHPFDVVLMDCQMPRMDGFEATVQVRLHEKHTGSRRTKIVALTANAIKGDGERCLAAGMDYYLTKPVDPVRLVEVLREIERAKDNPPPEEMSRPAVHPASDQADAPIQSEQLLERCMGNADLMRQVLGSFQQQLTAMTEEIANAVKADDPVKLARVAHSLKGASATLSAVEMKKIAEKLENIAATGNLGEAENTLNSLRNGVVHCNEFITQLKTSSSR